ncbi:hypothetical protein HWV62_2766 [Athelia sp. TMB]|nr:hypothetical protein HWV62_2766 [Athelia sp. TMB]
MVDFAKRSTSYHLRVSKEVEVLDASESEGVTDGIIEDEDDEDDNAPSHGGSGTEIAKRWTRIIRCAVGMAQTADGLTWVEGTKKWKVEGALSAKVQMWKESERRKDIRRLGTRWTDDAMDVDEDGIVADSSDSNEDAQDLPEVKALKSLIQSAGRDASPLTSRKRLHPSRRGVPALATLPIVPGYTVLVVDTNILLSSLSMLASDRESPLDNHCAPPCHHGARWPSANTSQLGEAAKAAMQYLTTHLRSHSTSLKVQTSEGNYLTSLNIRTEQVDFRDEASWERNMDDLILWKFQMWMERLEREVEYKRRLGTRWTDGAVDVDEDGVVADSSDSDEDAQHLPEAKTLKARRRSKSRARKRRGISTDDHVTSAIVPVLDRWPYPAGARREPVGQHYRRESSGLSMLFERRRSRTQPER